MVDLNSWDRKMDDISACDFLAEPYRIKVVEQIRIPNKSEREQVLAAAHYSVVNIDAADVYVDLATDSGTGSMSDKQWAGLMRGDESYVGSRSFKAFEAAVHEITGFAHAVPTHQGRAAENIIMGLLVKPGDMVLSNTHFDTTRAHVLNRDAMPIDLVGDAFWDFDEEHPFKGNFDLDKLEAALARYHERVPFVFITVLNNFACSSPVSMENIRAVRKLALDYGKPVFFDAARFSENAYFIKMREPGYAGTAVRDIVREMFSYADGCWMSAKKDAIVNTGGFIALEDEDLATRARERLVLYEGFQSYGGLAGRDLEALAIGLAEGTDPEYLNHRLRQSAYLGEKISEGGVRVSKPVGGSGVFVDVLSLYPHLAEGELPAIAFAVDMYLEGAVRVGGARFPLTTLDPTDGSIVQKSLQFSRLAIPRRTYTKGHLDYVAEVVSMVRRKAADNPGYRITYMPEVLGHFFAKFEPLRAGNTILQDGAGKP